MTNLDDLIDLRKKFETNFKKFKKGQITFKTLKELVLQIENAQKEYDIDSNFTDAQKIVHDFLIKVDTEQLGSIENKKALDLIDNFEKIANAIQPNVSEGVAITLAGILPGSTVFMYDFIQKERDGLVFAINVEQTKEKLVNVIKAAPTLLEEKFTKKHLQEFNTKTGMKTEETYEIAKALLKIMPERSAKETSVSFSMNTDKEQVNLDINKEYKNNLVISKSKIYSVIKPEEQVTLEGKLGIMEEWDDNHKFVIIDIDRNSHTINYEPTDDNKQYIKDNIGNEVRILRERNPDDNRKWNLSKWLSNNGAVK